MRRRYVSETIFVYYLFVFFFNNYVITLLPRLSPQQQPRQLDNRAQIRFLRRGRHGLLYSLPENAQPQTQPAHHSLLLQRAHQRFSALHGSDQVLQSSRVDGAHCGENDFVERVQGGEQQYAAVHPGQVSEAKGGRIMGKFN